MSIEINKNFVAELSEAAFRALVKTGDALRTEVIEAQVVPRRQGTLQDTSFIEADESAGAVRLIFNQPYAEHLYRHPEYNFNRGKKDSGSTGNPNARGEWLEPWISGEEAGRSAEIFAAQLKEEMSE